MNIEYKEVPKNYDFSTNFPTYIIAYEPSYDEWFVTNLRFFFYEYPKEFNSYEEGKNYFMNNLKEFLELKHSMKDAVDFYEFHKNELYFKEKEAEETIMVYKEEGEE